MNQLLNRMLFFMDPYRFVPRFIAVNHNKINGKRQPFDYLGSLHCSGIVTDVIPA